MLGELANGRVRHLFSPLARKTVAEEIELHSRVSLASCNTGERFPFSQFSLTSCADGHIQMFSRRLHQLAITTIFGYISPVSARIKLPVVMTKAIVMG